MRIPDLLVAATEPPTVDGPAAHRRRRVVTGVAIVIGTALLAATLRVPEGSAWFPALGVLVAATWTVGAFLSGPIPFRARKTGWRTLVEPVTAGVVAFGAFFAAYLVGRHLPLVGPALDGVLTTADAGSIGLVLFVALVNGAGEELFFRGALHRRALEPHHPAITTTIAYVVVTAATGNVALILAAAVMGVLFSLERLSTRGVLAPLVTHLTWSTLMILALPR